MPNADVHHGSYARRIADNLRQYAQDLLEENGRLRGLADVLQTEVERVSGQSQGLRRENEDLRDRLRLARMETSTAIEELLDVRRELESREQAQSDLQRRLQATDEQNAGLADRFRQLEEQSNNVANLYVASYRLHGTLDRDEVITVLQEILANLVGSEETALFERRDDELSLSLVAWNGLEPERLRQVPLGHGLIGRVAETGDAYLAGRPEPAQRAVEEEHLTACIPLKLNGRVAGVIAVFRLLPQKTGLGELDTEIFDLLASHAATALYCTSLHARTARGGA